MGNTVRTQPNIGQQKSSEGKAAFIQPAITPVSLVSLIGANMGSDQYIQIWDANAEGDAEAVQLFAFQAPGGKTFSLDTPIAFARGVYITNASQDTSASPTADQGGDDCWFLTRHL